MPLASHEDQFISATIAAVKKLSDAGSSRRWWLKKVVKSTQSICVSCAATSRCAARQAEVEFVAMEGSRGKESTSRRMSKGVGNGQCKNGMWEYFTLKRAETKKILEDAARERQEGIQGQRQQEPPPSETFWSKSEEIWMWHVAPK